MSKFKRGLIIVILIGILALIRAVSDRFFYDPLLVFFKNDYLNRPLPETDFFKLFYNLGLRYFMNSMISLAIIYLVFLKRTVVIFSAWIFLGGFLIFIIPYFFIISNYHTTHYLTRCAFK